MNKWLRSVVVSTFFLAGLGVSAQTILTAAVGLALPPYVLKDTNNGIEVDIVRQALKNVNYDVKLKLMPFGQVAQALKDKTVDCAFTVNEASGVTGVFYSQSHITYQNDAVALKSKGLKITNVAGLVPYRVAAFQNATEYLGKPFAEMAKAKGPAGYTELADQEAQVKLLFTNKADVLVTDINIFKYFRQAIKGTDVSAEVEFFQIFPPTYYKVAFISEEIRDKFNEGLAKLKASGTYAGIFRTYIK